jgi:hypothetical protein
MSPIAERVVVFAALSIALSSQSAGWALQPLPTPAPAAAENDVVDANQLGVAYENLRAIWDDCFKLKNTTADILEEGRNAPARKTWVNYYSGTVSQLLSDMRSQYNQTRLPADLQASVASDWSKVDKLLASLQQHADSLQTTASGLSAPTDTHTPFWEPAGSIAHDADELDKSMLSVFRTLEQSHDNSVLSRNEETAPPATGNGGSADQPASASDSVALKGSASVNAAPVEFKDVTDAAEKVRKSCVDLFGELDRFNLLYGNPSSNPANMFYGGAFTKQEVLTQYRYMPEMVFTTNPYVMLNSYRLPPRQNMLALYTKQIGSLLNLMDSELLSVQISPDRKDAVAGPWEAAKQRYVDARNQYMTLYNLVQNTTNKRLKKNIRQDQTDFGAPAMAIYQDMDQLRTALADLKALDH